MIQKRFNQCVSETQDEKGRRSEIFIQNNYQIVAECVFGDNPHYIRQHPEKFICEDVAKQCLGWDFVLTKVLDNGKRIEIKGDVKAIHAPYDTNVLLELEQLYDGSSQWVKGWFTKRAVAVYPFVFNDKHENPTRTVQVLETELWKMYHDRKHKYQHRIIPDKDGKKARCALVPYRDILRYCPSAKEECYGLARV